MADKTLHSGTNPYQSPESPDGKRTGVLPSLMLGTLGALVGAVAFMQIFACVGYYVGTSVHGFGRQPPVQYVVLSGFIGTLVGIVLGSVAGIRIRHGSRPSALVVMLVALINTIALLGTIDLSWEVSFQSLTLRTILVGVFLGLPAGAILGVIFNR